MNKVQAYLRDFLKKRDVKVEYFGPLSEYETGKRKRPPQNSKDIKTLGYGVPYLVVYKTQGKRKESIISTMRIGKGFGHDFRADRVDNLVLSFDTWGDLPKHCKVQDIGAFAKKDSSMISLGHANEFFLLRPKVEGSEYYKDLDRLTSEGRLESYDVPRARALAEYLVSIHKIKPVSQESELYERKIRDTLGHGECIFGLADSYPPEETTDFLKKGELAEIEKKCVDHRWRLKWNADRLAQVHGDFHPWNILFSTDIKRKATDFLLLDRSRGAFGEPADDVCALSINYIFYSLRKYGKLEGEFRTLYDEFMRTYLEQTKDTKILEAMPLFYTFRALVIASPIWYPTLSRSTRRQIFNFAHNILSSDSFEPSKVNEYLMEPTA
ncbi:MAG: aminoglycoside phosphotransferase family protein [Nitrososphaerales archaeon]